MASKGEMSIGTRFLLGGAAGCGASACVHPLDVCRIQMQVDAEGGGVRMYKSTSHCLMTLVRRGGVSTIYAGISAGMLRQVSYGMPRFGLYTIFVGEANKKYLGTITPFAVKLGMGATAGGLAACIGNPAEVALVRMAADSKAPIAERRNYKNGLDCITRVFREEGVGALYRGVGATVVRAMLLNSCQLGIYSEAKETLIKNTPLTDGPDTISKLSLQFTGSIISSFFAALASTPADVIKSRLQNQPSVDGKPVYSGLGDCMVKLVKSEGVLAFWKGFTPAWIKIAPHTVISFVILEQLTHLITGGAAM